MGKEKVVFQLFSQVCPWHLWRTLCIDTIKQFLFRQITDFLGTIARNFSAAKKKGDNHAIMNNKTHFATTFVIQNATPQPR